MPSKPSPCPRYEVVSKSQKCLFKIAELIQAKYSGLSGIVYCFSQLDCERCSAYLTVWPPPQSNTKSTVLTH